MAKLTLTDITAGFDTTAYNANNTLIEAALENTLSRDGTIPNEMDADIDMNSYDVNNVNRLNTVELYLNGVKTTGVTVLPDLDDINDVTITAVSLNDILKWNGSAWVNGVLQASDIPSLDTAKITTGTFADGRIAASNVTQHQAALSVTLSQVSDVTALAAEVNLLDLAGLTARDVLVAATATTASWRPLVEADISDLQAYLTSEVNNLTAAVTWANVPDANITQSSVTQHEAALTILESQITDAGLLARNAGTETISGQWTFSNAIDVGGGVTAGDNASVGYSAVDGLQLTGQGSANDVALINDLGQSVLTIPTGTTTVNMSGQLSVANTVSVGSNGAGDSIVQFYDDNSDTYRSIFWDDSLNAFFFEDNAGGFNELGTGTGGGGTGFLLIGA